MKYQISPLGVLELLKEGMLRGYHILGSHLDKPLEGM